MYTNFHPAELQNSVVPHTQTAPPAHSSHQPQPPVADPVEMLPPFHPMAAPSSATAIQHFIPNTILRSAASGHDSSDSLLLGPDEEVGVRWTESTLDT